MVGMIATEDARKHTINKHEGRQVGSSNACNYESNKVGNKIAAMRASMNGRRQAKQITRIHAT